MNTKLKPYLYVISILVCLFSISTVYIKAQTPSAPAQVYDRFGSYFWTTTYEGYDRLRIDNGPLSCTSIGNRQLVDTLSVGKDLLASLETRTIRVVIGNYGGRYSHGYENCSGTLTLKEWVQGSEYTDLFSDSRFNTYLITYFPSGWADNITTDGSGKKTHNAPSNYNTAYNQMKELVEYLVGQESGSFRFPGKTFIIMNWEADSQLESFINDPLFISGTATWDPSNSVYGSFWVEYEKAIRAYAQGAKDATRPTGSNQPKAFFGFEFSKFNRYKAPPSDFTFIRACGDGNPQSPDNRMEWRCAMSYLPARFNISDYGYSTPAPIDYWSYSAYDTTNSATPNQDYNINKRVRDDLTKVLGWANVNQSSQSQFQPKDLIIGEFGYSNNTILKDPSKENIGESFSAKYIKEAMAAFSSFGVSHAIYFQGTDAIDPGSFGAVTDLSLFTGSNAFLETSTFVRTAAGESFARTSHSDTVWMEDDPPTTKQVYPSGTWNTLTSTTFPRQVSGSKAFQTDIHTSIAPDGYAYFFEGASQQLTINTGDTLFAYVYIDPVNTPSEIMLQWKNGSWSHRAYWGQTIINWGTDGTASSRRIGDLPPTGKWVRLEVPANVVGLEGSSINGFSVALTNGRIAFDRAGKIAGEFIWADDSIASGQQHTYVECACTPYSWMEITSSPLPISGSKAYQTGTENGYVHTQYFDDATPMGVNAGDILFSYVYLDPANPPETVMIQWHEDGGNWEHRAYWGKPNNITWATDGTEGNYYMGPLPPLGQWVRIGVLADSIGLRGKSVDGFGLALFSGRAAWDRVGKITNDVVWLDDLADIPTGNRYQDGGDSWTNSLTLTTPISGSQAIQTISSSSLHQLYAANLTNTLTINTGDTLLVYVYIDPNNIPDTIMLQWNAGDSTTEEPYGWGHRAYWGEEQSDLGDEGPLDTLFNTLYTSVSLQPLNYYPGTAAHRYMGALPEKGKWIRLEVPASRLGLEGKTLSGFAFRMYGGRAVFDRIGKVRNEHLDK